MELKILHFYPDLMSLYGSYANVSILKRTLEEMGNPVAVEQVAPGADADPAAADFVYMGAGTEHAQKAALMYFSKLGDRVKAAAESGVPMLFDERKPVSWILPAICMSLGGIANYAMWIRRYMVDELNKDYIKLARAKGLKNSLVMSRHVIRNAFVPMAQQLPTNILMTISGSIYVESLFSIPGMGGLLVSAIQRQDNTLVQALVLIYSCIGILGLFLGDLLMALCDPRIKLGKKGGGR